MLETATSVLACLLILAGVAGMASAGGLDVIVQEVNIGTTVELPCPSSDDFHRFQFWVLINNEVLGPGNEMDPAKYKYDVLSGRLHIKSISSTESGRYTCVSRALATDSSFHSKSVEVIVKKDWEELYETDAATNLMRGLIAMGVLLIIFIVGIIIYIFRKNRVLNMREMPDEESPDDMSGTYNPTTMPNNEDVNHSLGVDNSALETDFPQVFQSMQNINDSRI